MIPSREVYIIVAIVLVGILFLVNPSWQQHISQTFSPKDKPITELYVSSMPKTQDNKTTFTFTLHNLMDKDFSYSYVVYVKGSQNEYAVLDNSAVALANGATVTINESVIVPYASTTLYVELPQLGQQLHVAL